jgi:predicted permease
MLVRAALGASRLQLIAPLMRESVMIGLISGMLGYGLAYAALVQLSAFKLSIGIWPSPAMDLRPDGLVLGITAVIAIVVGLGVGLLPAWRAASDGLSGAINRELMASEPRKARIRNVLVVIQMAVATLAMIGVGVSLRSFLKIEHVPLGFSARHLVYAGVDLRRAGYDERAGRQFYERVRERVATLPGVEAVTLADNPPLSGFARDVVTADTSPTPPDAKSESIPYAVVGNEYFTAIGMAVLQGRTFDSRDRSGSPEVVVINATMARQQWLRENPLGQRIRVGSGHRTVEVIGVVPDSKYEDLTEPPLPFMYFTLAQHYAHGVTVIARTAGRQPTVEAVMQELLNLEPRLATGGGFGGGMTLDDLLRLSLLLPRAIAAIASVFGALTLALAVLGLYSTVFYSVSQRRTEMGIRVALGAQPIHIFKTVLGHMAWVALTGGVLGVGAGLALLPFASSIFYGIGSVEPLVLASVSLVSIVIALITTWVVARPWTQLSSLDLLRQ